MAYYCLHKFHKWPHEFLELDEGEKAVVTAAVLIKVKADRKRAAEVKRVAGRKS